MLKLADNVRDAMNMMQLMEHICDCLPGIDCGTCGAPSCRALAEDMVRGDATEADCVFFFKNHTKENASDEYIPVPFRKKENEK